MQGGINDGIALALTSSMHLRDGTSSRPAGTTTSTRGSGTPRPRCEVIVMPSDSGQPGGAGEAGVAATFAAVACAYARATGTHAGVLPGQPPRRRWRSEPKPFVPPDPASPTNGLKLTF